MISRNKICVFDFETDGSNPDVCSPVQLSAVMVDPIKLEVIASSEFNVHLKPERLEKCKATIDDHPYTDSDILEWHGKVQGKTKEEILNSWINYPEQQHSWSQFTNYLSNYHYVGSGSKKTQFTAPVAAGYNILRFDLPIIDRLSVKYKNTNKENRTDLFHPRDKLDIMHIVYLWLKDIPELKSISLDSIREYLGIDGTNAHDAVKDVKDCAEILIRFLRLHKKLSSKILFKNSFQQTV